MIPLNDLQRHCLAVADEVSAAVSRVTASGWYILGKEVSAFEEEFAAYCGTAHCVGVGNGTDALELAMRCVGVAPGKKVVTVGNAGLYSTVAIRAIGAEPLYVDIDHRSMLVSAEKLARVDFSGVAAIVATHLYGRLADMEAILAIASKHAIAVIEDCAQAHGAMRGGKRAGSFGALGCFSFYPTKNLGALGDGGAVITGNASLAGRIRRLRHGGQADRYRHVVAGVNSRLDELQAAVLNARLPRLAQWTARRRALARLYRQALPPSIATLRERDRGHVYHLFPVRVPGREALQARLASAGIETLIHYPYALTDQPAFAPLGPHACPVAGAAAREVLSLPLHPRLADADVIRVAREVDAYQKGLSLA